MALVERGLGGNDTDLSHRLSRFRSDRGRRAEDMRRLLGADLPIEEWGREEGIDESHLRERVEEAANAMMAAKAANYGPDLMRFIEKS